MDSLEKVSLENEILEFETLRGRDILSKYQLQHLRISMCHALLSVAEYPSREPWTYQSHS